MYFKVDNKKNVSISGFIQNFSWYIHETQVYLKITMASNIDKHSLHAGYRQNTWSYLWNYWKCSCTLKVFLHSDDHRGKDW